MIKDLVRSLLPSRLWTLLRLARGWLTLARFKEHTVRHNYGGTPLEVLISDPLARGWYDHDWSELDELRLLRRHGLREGARVFDLGAHQCVVALLLADAVGRDGQVVAVEANEHNVAAGRKNVELNNRPQVIVLHAAASDSDGELFLNRSLNAQVDDGNGVWGRVSVPARSLDSLSDQFGMPNVLFIDVEGFELQVLRGGTRTLATLPDCFVEVHVELLRKYESSVDDVLAFFPPDTYERFAASEAEREFRNLSECAHLIGERFFLVAIVRNRT